MSHYDVDYSKLEGDAKEEAARKDCCDWLGGKEKYANIVLVLTKTTKGAVEPNPDSLLFAISFAGIQGYPARVMVKDVFRNANVDLPPDFKV